MIELLLATIKAGLTEHVDRCPASRTRRWTTRTRFATQPHIMRDACAGSITVNCSWAIGVESKSRADYVPHKGRQMPCPTLFIGG